MSANEHGYCGSCGLDFNGDLVYDHFLKEYGGDTLKAAEVAEMYGCREGFGRFSKVILVKPYDKDYNKLPTYRKCPECGEKYYGTP